MLVNPSLFPELSAPLEPSEPAAPIGSPAEPAAPVPSSAAAVARLSVVQLAFKDTAALYAAFIPLFKEGGVFISTTRDYQLGADVYLLITLPGDPQRIPVAGKVAWVTPAKAAGSRTQGVGVCFPSDEKSNLLKLKIEELLGAHLVSDRPTLTI